MLNGTLYQSVYTILENLAATNSRNEKEEILRKNIKNNELKYTFYYALNPFYQYGVRQIPNYHSEKGPGATTLLNVLKRLHVLYNRQKTGHAAQKWLVREMEGLSDEDARVLELVLNRDLRCGVSEKTVNKIWPNLIPEFPNMLASPMKEENLKNITFPAYIQEKMDGQRANLFCNSKTNSVTVRTRNGKEIESLENHFSREIGNISSDFVLDGELLVVDKNENYLPRKKSNGILTKIQKGTAKEDEIASVRMVLWDAIPFAHFEKGVWNEPYKKRFQLLENFLNRSDINTYGSLSVIDTETVESMYEARSYFMRKIEDGSEGAILKNINHIWENARSKEQIKMKADYSADLRVVDVVEGRGKYENFLGSLQLESEDGKVSVNCGSGFSDEDREVLFSNNLIGKIVSINYNGIIDRDKTETKSLFLPIFEKVRYDKDNADYITDLN